MRVAVVMERDSVAEDDGVNGVYVLLVRWQEEDIVRVPLARETNEGVLQVLIALIEYRAFLFLLLVFIIVIS